MVDKIINLIKTTFINNSRKESIDYSTWAFSSSFNTKFNYNSKYLFEYVLKNEPGINPIYVINDDELRKKLQREYGKKYFTETKSIAGIKRVLNAGVWFTSAGLPVYGLGLNKKRLIINLWHGVPLKKIALMENNIRKLNRMYFKYVFSNNYTHILSTSKSLVPIMMESFDVTEDRIKIWGQPRNDAIFNNNNQKKVLMSIYGKLPNYKKAILYAPTFRKNTGTHFFPFNDLNYNDLNHFLEKNELIVFIRCHQSETQNIKNSFGNRVKLINSDKVEEIMDIINIFDLLITDYSSIYIDYLLTENPIIFLPYDKEKYLKERGLNFNYDEVTPGPKPETLEGLKFEITKLLYDSNYYSIERHKTNMFFNEVNHETSPNICDLVKKDINEKINKKVRKA
jgi:CDP-glycerol glycerophosphotransferase